MVGCKVDFFISPFFGNVASVIDQFFFVAEAVYKKPSHSANKTSGAEMQSDSESVRSEQDAYSKISMLFIDSCIFV